MANLQRNPGTKSVCAILPEQQKPARIMKHSMLNGPHMVGISLRDKDKRKAPR